MGEKTHIQYEVIFQGKIISFWLTHCRLRLNEKNRTERSEWDRMGYELDVTYFWLSKEEGITPTIVPLLSLLVTRTFSVSTLLCTMGSCKMSSLQSTRPCLHGRTSVIGPQRFDDKNQTLNWTVPPSNHFSLKPGGMKLFLSDSANTRFRMYTRTPKSLFGLFPGRELPESRIIP